MNLIRQSSSPLICVLTIFCMLVNVGAAADVELFNGENLDGWDGDPKFWRVEDGVIIGETTAEKQAEKNTFLIYRGDEFADFELRFEYQVTGYNSGVQYRSRDLGDWSVSGYQCDFEDQRHKEGDTKVDRFTGMLYEEQGRGILAERGDVVIIRPNSQDVKKPHIEGIGTVGDPKELETYIRRSDWNTIRVIAKGNQLVHLVNGHVMAIGIDEDAAQSRDSGILAFQLHRGPPMKIQLRNIRIRELK